MRALEQKNINYLLPMLLLLLGNIAIAQSPQLQLRCHNAYHTPDLAILTTAKKTLFPLLLQAEHFVLNDKIKKIIQQHQWYIKKFTLSGHQVLSLKENKTHCDGKGNYAIKLHPTEPILLEAPHSYFDSYTGKIVSRLFLSGRFKAAAWNSIQRYEKRRIGTSNADLSKLANSYLMAMSEAFLSTFPKGVIVQIHGFSKKKRQSYKAAQADIILSHGNRIISPAIYQLKQCLSHAFIHHKVYLYPQDINELGATKNSIAKALYKFGMTHFFHVELSVELRKKLVRNNIFMQHFTKCLHGVSNV